MDMAANMQLAIKRCFVNAHRVIDRFHVQKLAYDAVQEARIKYRWEALDAENEAIDRAKRNKTSYQPEILPNGDTLKQLLARSRYLLFKHHIKWTAIQKHRAELLFERYPQLKKAYQISLKLGDIFKLCKSKEQAFKQLALWYNVVEDCGIDAFKTVARSIKANYLSILNFFINRSTNASAESFNAKVRRSGLPQEVLGISNFSCSDSQKYMLKNYSPQEFRLILDDAVGNAGLIKKNIHHFIVIIGLSALLLKVAYVSQGVANLWFPLHSRFLQQHYLYRFFECKCYLIGGYHVTIFKK